MNVMFLFKKKKRQQAPDEITYAKPMSPSQSLISTLMAISTFSKIVVLTGQSRNFWSVAMSKSAI